MENEVSTKLNFKEGDSVVLHHGIKGEFLDESVVTKVHKSGKFRIDGRYSTFSQTGMEVGEEGTWGQEWVEPWTPETQQKLKRHKLEVRTIKAANVLIQTISDVDSHKLEYVSAYLEDVNRKTKGE